MIKNSTRHNRLVDGSPVPDVEGCNEVAFPSSPQEMHLNRDRSGLFPLSTVWHAGHSMMVLRVFTTITGMPASVALYSMNDLSWWKDHELWMYLLPFLTVVLILMHSRFSRAVIIWIALKYLAKGIVKDNNGTDVGYNPGSRVKFLMHTGEW